MSLKSQTKKALRPPLTNKVPKSLLKDFETAVFFENTNLILHELATIVSSETQVTLVESDYTTDGSDILIADSTLTITLNDLPIDQETVKIKNIGGITTIDGNTRMIDGSEQLIINNKYDAPTITYIKSKDAWYIL